MKYNVCQYVTNMSDQYQAVVTATYTELEKALVKYHQLLAALHNAPDVKTATVLVVNEFGREVPSCYEMVEHEVPAPVVEETPTTPDA